MAGGTGGEKATLSFLAWEQTTYLEVPPCHGNVLFASVSEGPPSHSRPPAIGTPGLASGLAHPPALAAESPGPVSVPLLRVGLGP